MVAVVPAEPVPVFIVRAEVECLVFFQTVFAVPLIVWLPAANFTHEPFTTLMVALSTPEPPVFGPPGFPVALVMWPWAFTTLSRGVFVSPGVNVAVPLTVRQTCSGV